MEKTTYKIATKFKYIGKEEVAKPGDIFKKGTFGYGMVEGEVVTLKNLGQLYIAVDSMFYDYSNQWEEGLDPYELMKDVMEIMHNISTNNLGKGEDK